MVFEAKGYHPIERKVLKLNIAKAVGLLSIFVFTVVHNMPMLFTWILHSIPGFAIKSMDRPPADPMALEEEEEGNIS